MLILKQQQQKITFSVVTWVKIPSNCKTVINPSPDVCVKVYGNCSTAQNIFIQGNQCLSVIFIVILPPHMEFFS